VSAQPREIALNIPAQSLAAALTAVATRANVQVLFDEALVEGHSAAALQGRLTPQAALTQLLRGTNLIAVAAGPDTFTVQRANPPGAPRTVAAAPAVASPPEIRLEPVIVQERSGADAKYVVTHTATGTRTDTPLIEIPQSIQVLDRQQLDDQQVLTLPEALRWVPGVSSEGSRGGFDDTFVLRGFDASGFTFLDGLRVDPRFWIAQEVFGLERIEVLKGPASVLYGQVAPGGIVNLISKRPRPEPHYELGFTAGSDDFYEATVDLGGPLLADKSLLYRLTGLYLNRGDFVEFVDKERVFLAPALTWRIGPDTTLTVLSNALYEEWVESLFLPAEGTVLANPNGTIPRHRFAGEPGFDRDYAWRLQVGYQFEHRLHASLHLQHSLRVQYFEFGENAHFPLGLLDDQRRVDRFVSRVDISATNIGTDTHLAWTFQTGPLAHRLLGGVDVLWDRFRFTSRSGSVAPLDLFTPVYGAPVTIGPVDFDSAFFLTQVGLYVQDQVQLLQHLSILLGGRFDLAWNDTDNRLTRATTQQDDDAFTWRAGLVYQFLTGLAAYASYATSFQPVTFGARASGAAFDPERGEQYEVGLKADLWRGRVASTLAFYHLLRDNVTTTDPTNPNFSIQTGEQRSRGIEWNVQARPVDGWDFLAFYAYTDAEITQDTTFTPGNRLLAVPFHTGGLWTTWQFPWGPVKGLGAGFGVRYVGDRAGDLDNSFALPDYTVFDAAVFYRYGPLNVQVNLKNFTDEVYFTSRSRTFVEPGEPLTVLGRVTWRFQ
jgi:iron complex outermembrane receptor protein